MWKTVNFQFFLKPKLTMKGENLNELYKLTLIKNFFFIYIFFFKNHSSKFGLTFTEINFNVIIKIHYFKT